MDDKSTAFSIASEKITNCNSAVETLTFSKILLEKLTYSNTTLLNVQFYKITPVNDKSSNMIELIESVKSKLINISIEIFNTSDQIRKENE